MTIQTPPAPTESVGTPERTGRRVALIFLLVLLVLISVGVGLGYYRASHADHPPTYTSEQMQAMANLKLPAEFTRVDSTWGCVSNEQSACFISSLNSRDAVEALASSMASTEYTTVFGNSVFTDRYNFCTTIASAPAFVIVDPRPSNAVKRGGSWVVPPGHEPKFDGTAVDVYLTGPGTCP